MSKVTCVMVFGCLMTLGGVSPVFALDEGAVRCFRGAVPVGSICVDRYEASVWETRNDGLIRQIQLGKVTLDSLLKAGAIQRGATVDDYPCSDNGNDCKDNIFAVSIPGVIPARSITWFQAQQACANSGKQLLTNAIWQMAAAGTPDGAPCNVSSGAASPTGTPGCISVWGAFDMVGNVTEWVADWIQGNTNPWNPGSGTTASNLYGNDFMDGINRAQASPGSIFPAALHRGGDFNSATTAGVFALSAGNTPSNAGADIGFRCGR